MGADPQRVMRTVLQPNGAFFFVNETEQCSLLTKTTRHADSERRHTAAHSRRGAHRVYHSRRKAHLHPRGGTQGRRGGGQRLQLLLGQGPALLRGASPAHQRAEPLHALAQRRAASEHRCIQREDAPGRARRRHAPAGEELPPRAAPASLQRRGHAARRIQGKNSRLPDENRGGISATHESEVPAYRRGHFAVLPPYLQLDVGEHLLRARRARRLQRAGGCACARTV